MAGPNKRRRDRHPDVIHTAPDAKRCALSRDDNMESPDTCSLELPDHDIADLYDQLGLDIQAAEQPLMTIDDILDEALFVEDDEPRHSNELDSALPPSSLVRALDRASRSADEFDPDLLYSTPSSSTGARATQPQHVIPPLTQDSTNWEDVRLSLDDDDDDDDDACKIQPTHRPTNESVALPTPTASALPSPSSSSATWEATAQRANPSTFFFHVQDMLSAKAAMYKNQPHVALDWYARVLYSSRENFFRKQYFQFRDLFKETPPYLTGALVD
ncbi:hypothetical protein L249_2777 [Ophiocordyceps polyrhachis-furcata BCC 54312]|uniref:Uncharacterized protein n=1 Tax=Ophiocordyceps polyrhachis-furcata BCC 54312 TaxID=1330021 RepID=A0A367LN61_9HYPO|nr:hypothetical protein L249_2777 [Ophiocordyceps polyrhachis-furcata BCC 54312]